MPPTNSIGSSSNWTRNGSRGISPKKLEVLKGQHHKEKEDALAEFAAYKQKVKEREMKLQCEFQNRFDMVNGQLDDVRSNFEKRVKQFAEAMALMEKKSSSNNDDLERLRKEHMQEMADHVRDHNSKFNDMLMEQMNVQEKMKEKHDAEMEAMRSSMQSKHAEEMEAMRSQLMAEHATAMGGAQKKWVAESAEALRECKEGYEEKIQAMLADLKTSKAECKRLEEEAARSGSSSAELGKEIDGLKKEAEEMKKLLKEKDEYICDTEEQLTNVTEELKETLAQLKTLQDEHASQSVKLEAVESDGRDKATTIDRRRQAHCRES